MCSIGNTCHEHATCTNVLGGYECNCITGYGGDGFDCSGKLYNFITITNLNNILENDECDLGTHVCHSAATCTNTVGSYDCECELGYFGDGYDCTGKIRVI